MFVNLTDVFTSEGKTVTMQVEPGLTEVAMGGAVYPVRNMLPMELNFTNIGKGKVRITGHADVTLGMSCDRCLKPVDKTLKLAFDREVLAPDVTDAVPDEEYAQEIMDGYQLNTDDLLYIEIVINWPMKVLCKPDCLGICRQCGRDLNTGTCECDTFVPDPRMAVIKDIFNGNKEV